MKSRSVFHWASNTPIEAILVLPMLGAVLPKPGFPVHRSRCEKSGLGAMYGDLQQTVTKDDFRELKHTVAELAEAQVRAAQGLDCLAQRVAEMAEAQRRSEERAGAGFRDLNNRFGVLGARWGDNAEEAFRRGLLEIARELGYTVEHYQGQDPAGYINHAPRSFDLDVLVRDGELVVAEIKSHASGADVTEFSRSVQLYEQQTGRRVSKRVLVAVTIQAVALERAQELGMVVATNLDTLSPHRT